jgi:hypothetical protein
MRRANAKSFSSEFGFVAFCPKDIWLPVCILLDMENIEYTEWVPAGALVKVLFVAINVVIVFASVWVFLFSSDLLAEDVFGVAFAWAVLAILLFVFWNFRGLRIEIRNGRLSIEYGLFNKKSFLLNEIVSCKKTRAFGRYMGVGVRYGFDGSMAYTTSFGDAVEVVPKVGRSFVFSSKNPDQVCAIIAKGSLS